MRAHRCLDSFIGNQELHAAMGNSRGSDPAACTLRSDSRTASQRRVADGAEDAGAHRATDGRPCGSTEAGPGDRRGARGHQCAPRTPAGSLQHHPGLQAGSGQGSAVWEAMAVLICDHPWGDQIPSPILKLSPRQMGMHLVARSAMLEATCQRALSALTTP